MRPGGLVYHSVMAQRKEMNLSRKDKIFIAALLGAITSTIISLWLMYQSGCAGDLKTGTYGDPIEALHIESMAMQVLFIAMNLYAMAYFLKSKESVPLRIIAALGIMVAVFVISFIPGVYFQGLGVASCH
jgi:Na+/pantothenate symporter